MKIPVSPPDYGDMSRSIAGDDGELFLRLLGGASPVDSKGRYLHWDKLRHLAPPTSPSPGLSSEQWWFSIKTARRNLYKPLPLKDKQGRPFQFAVPDKIAHELHWLDRHAAGSIQSDDTITNDQTRNTYLICSLIEEAINSSQLEGASTTRDVAKEMIRQDRAPKNNSEQMILNNYLAMQFIREIKDEALTPSIVFELHRLVTRNTLNEASVGRFRTVSDEIHVVDNATQKYLHTPPLAKQLPERMDALCDFANRGSSVDAGETFLHPVIQSITLHFMLAYDHPFCDGNGRTARALFYWSMAKQGYWLAEFVSISRVIKRAPAQYANAFLHTETDDNDLTYFLVHQLDVIHQAIEALHIFLEKKSQGISEAKRLLVDNPRLHGKLNFRQLALLRHALKHPRFSYVVQEHQRSHGISYDVARKDLLQMADTLKLLIKTKQGKRYYFVVPNDLEERIAN
ncbi:MAG: Fic family protein [Gammaproteobacteria bacterium]|nr:Fic family protein [Gammaproteobacteria bacterium]